MTIHEPNRSQSRRLAALAERGVQTFREENPDPYNELVSAFDGKSADVALLGHAGFHVAVDETRVRIEPDKFRGTTSTGSGTVSPETLIAMLEGRLTPLEAFFKGDLQVRAQSPELHVAYGYFVKFADTALRSERLQQLLGEFRALLEQGGEDEHGRQR